MTKTVICAASGLYTALRRLIYKLSAQGWPKTWVQWPKGSEMSKLGMMSSYWIFITWTEISLPVTEDYDWNEIWFLLSSSLDSQYVGGYFFRSFAFLRSKPLTYFLSKFVYFTFFFRLIFMLLVSGWQAQTA